MLAVLVGAEKVVRVAHDMLIAPQECRGDRDMLCPLQAPMVRMQARIDQVRSILARYSEVLDER